MSKFIEVPASNISKSKRTLAYGIGINDAPYMVTYKKHGEKVIHCPYYTTWKNMIKRCYSEASQKKSPRYADCSVCEEWFLFSVFKSWMGSQDWKNKDLDKDIKVIGNKEYSPDTCLFISHEINSMFGDHAAKRGSCAIGVHYDKKNKKYVSQCSYNNSFHFLGRYKTEQKAHEVYRKFKNKIIIEAANNPENAYIKKYLLNYASHLLGQTL